MVTDLTRSNSREMDKLNKMQVYVSDGLCSVVFGEFTIVSVCLFVSSRVKNV